MAPWIGMVGVRDLDLTAVVREATETGGIQSALEAIRNADGRLIDVWNWGRPQGAIDVSLFVLIIGGFLGIVSKTGALDAGIAALVNKLKGGREMLLIPILMLVFSIGGTTYGMAEETLAFYALIGATMIKAGFDPLVSAAVIAIGAYAGGLGSTINPFSVGASISAAEAAGTHLNQGTIIALSSILWLSVLGVTIWYVMRYAKKVYADRSNSLMTTEELEISTKALTHHDKESEVLEFTFKRKVVLALFVFTFIVMILGVIPWGSFGITIFDNHTAWLTGGALGTWWFPELTIWFLVMSIVTGVAYRMPEKELVSSFIGGSSEMVGVAFIIGLSRGISFMMTNTGLDIYILEQLSGVLTGVSGPFFAVMAFFIYIPLTFFIGSTSGLASVSMPVFAPLAENLGMAPELVVPAFTAAAGWLAFFSPTNPILMGGLEISKINYATWLKFVTRLVAIVFVLIVILLAIYGFILG
jgi:uncharacterized ion transporter superfamily protein YfcC